MASEEEKPRRAKPFGKVTRENRKPIEDEEEDEEEEEEDEEHEAALDKYYERFESRKVYRVVCDLEAGAVILQTLLFVLLMVVTLGCATPFFGYYFYKLILNHTRIEEVIKKPKRGR